jgi:hypothetical protein
MTVCIKFPLERSESARATISDRNAGAKSTRTALTGHAVVSDFPSPQDSSYSVPSSMQPQFSSIDHNDWSLGITGLNDLVWPSDWIMPVPQDNEAEEDVNDDLFYLGDI